MARIGSIMLGTAVTVTLFLGLLADGQESPRDGGVPTVVLETITRLFATRTPTAVVEELRGTISRLRRED